MTLTKCIDERAQIEASKVTVIKIDSQMADVNLLCSKSSNIEAHLFGKILPSDNIDFEFLFKDGTLNIAVKMQDHYENKVRLEIAIPQNVIRSVFITTISGNIFLGKDVKNEFIFVSTESGDTNSYAGFKKASFNSLTGDVNVHAYAHSDLLFRIRTMSGDISVKFKRICSFNVDAKSIEGSLVKKLRPHEGYNATAFVNSSRGNIKIG